MNAARIIVTGIVQGVGFRPFVRRLAMQLDLPGWVCNTADGVCIVIPYDAVELFQQHLLAEHPRLARIDAITSKRSEDELCRPFEIRASSAGDVQTGVAPDAATCSDCIAELNNPSDRRYEYPFLNCTNCGPRFSIVRSVPYDRSNTTMAEFELCAACRSEYKDMTDRRYHAQPVACPNCGPQIGFEGKAGHQPISYGQDALQQAIELIQSGGILAIRGIGGFHLACLACDEEAVATLRERKSRPTKPLAVMVRDIDVAKRYAVIDSIVEAQLLSPAAPIVLSQLKAHSHLAPSALSGVGKLGMMLPYSPLHHLLLDAFDAPLVMTSGNPKGAPQVTGNRAARAELADIADGWLLHNREIENRVDDSVVQIARSNTPQVLRRARGLAPGLISLPKGFDSHPDAIAFGADSKNAFALAKGGRAILSQHMGDLGDPRTSQDLLDNIDRLTRLFDVQPSVVMCDLHKGYRSSRLAQDYADAHQLPLIGVQHHHAHAASLMVEHKLNSESEVIALVQDGTGMGLSSDIWGAEILRVNYGKAQRIATLAPAAMQGGDAAAHEPWRNLVARLLARYGSYETWPPEYHAALADFPVQPACAAIVAGINAPLASSTGRLFDAVAAALGLAPTRQSFEGEAALRLEHAAKSYIDEQGTPDPLAFYSRADDVMTDLIVIDPDPIWDALIDEIKAETPARAAARFHLGWAVVWAKAALQGGDETPIALSGGSFQNQLISNRVADRVEETGKRVLQHSTVPPNDGGIALGQLAVGLANHCGHTQ